MKFISLRKKHKSQRVHSKIAVQKKKYVKNIALLILLIIIGFFLLKIYTYLLIKNYSIIGYNGTKKSSIENYLANSKPQPLFLLNERDLLIKLNKLDKNIQITAIKKIFPDKLEIQIKPQKGFMKVIINNNDVIQIKKILLESPLEATISSTEVKNSGIKKFVMSDTGVILDRAIDEGLPILLISNENQIEELQNNSLFDKIKEIQMALVGFKIPTEEIILIDNSIIVKENQETYIIFSVNKPIENQVRSLQVIIERFTIEGIKPKKIDVRFDKTVVLF